LKKSWDLVAIVALSLLLALVIYFLPDNALRVVLGLPFIQFFPGYALITTLFPERGSLDLIERIALSFGLSIAVTPLIGFGLNYTPFGIRLEPILWSLIAFNLVFSVAAFYRRTGAKDPFMPIQYDEFRSMIGKEFKGQTKVDKVLSIALVLAIISSISVLVYVIAVPLPGEKFTEFYILGPDGKATGYPHNLTVGEDGDIIIGIANHEYRTVNYTIEMWLVDSTFQNNQTTINQLIYFDSMEVTLNHTDPVTEGNWTAQWETPYTFSVDQSGEYKLWFILLQDSEPFFDEYGDDYADQEGVVNRFLTAIDDKEDVLSLNLNLNIT